MDLLVVHNMQVPQFHQLLFTLVNVREIIYQLSTDATYIHNSKGSFPASSSTYIHHKYY